MMLLSKCVQRIQVLKSSIHISIAKDLNKIRNSSNLIKQERRFLTKKPKAGLVLVSLTLVPFLPVAYARDVKLKKIDDEIKQIDEKVDKAVEEEADKEGLIDVEEKLHFTWTELWNLISPNFVYFAISILGSFAIAYLNIRIPICLGELTNQISKFVNTQFDSKEFMNSIKGPALKLVWSYLLHGLFTSITIISLSTLSENIAVDLKMQLFKSIINQDIEFFDQRMTGEILNVLTSDIQEFKSSFKTFFSQGLRSFTQTIGSAISLYLISPKISMFLCILVPNIVLVGSMIGHFLREISKTCQEQTSKCSAMANEVISSIRTIKATAMEKKEIELFNEEVNELSKLNKSLGLGIGIFQGLTSLALNGIVLSCMLIGGNLMSNNEISPGDLMSFLVASQTIQRSLASLSMMTGHYVKYVNTGNRIYDFIKMEPQLKSKVDAKRLDPLVGEITFRKVKFSYPTGKKYPIFDNFNFRINPGQRVAIVGHSGSGKSTIAMLLERFYDVDSGSVNIDGTNIKDLDLDWLRSENIGYINQEPSLFATTILENIRYGCPKATDKQVFEAARLANAHSFIESFPDSYQTVIGERGVTLSGGQKQRIAIAREILKNPKILICDEATSALDSESEKIISEALETLMKGRTVLIIAHRLSTVKNADLIAVLSNGKICEMGNHHELVQLKGLYWQLIKQQQSD